MLQKQSMKTALKSGKLSNQTFREPRLLIVAMAIGFTSKNSHILLCNPRHIHFKNAMGLFPAEVLKKFENTA